MSKRQSETARVPLALLTGRFSNFVLSGDTARGRNLALTRECSDFVGHHAAV
jgi:hypothetical protein